MQECVNEIKYDVSLRFLRRMMKEEKLTVEQAQIADRHLRKIYKIIA